MNYSIARLPRYIINWLDVLAGWFHPCCLSIYKLGIHTYDASIAAAKAACSWQYDQLQNIQAPGVIFRCFLKWTPQSFQQPKYHHMPTMPGYLLAVRIPLHWHEGHLQDLAFQVRQPAVSRPHRQATSLQSASQMFPWQRIPKPPRPRPGLPDVEVYRKMDKGPKCLSYCWCFRNPANQPVEGW